MLRVTVENRWKTQDFLARIKGGQGKEATGKTLFDALAKLLLGQQEAFGVAVDIVRIPFPAGTGKKQKR